MGRLNKKSAAKTSKKKVLVTVQRTQKKTRSRPRKSRLGMIGKIAGGFWGPHGADLGRAAGNMISKITGMGDYRINSNSISNGNSIPTFSSGTDGMAVCHREFISDINGSITFVNGGLPINPGMATCFPFLSKLAVQFEEYDFKGLVFEYRPTSGTAISTTSAALGVVVMATNYDAADPLFTTKQQMESYEFANATVPFTGCIHPVECARNRNVLESLYIRTSAPGADLDIRMYDLGLFQIATSGMQSAYTIGELWVSYDVRLRKPRLYIPPTLTQPYSYHITSGPTATAGTNSNLMGTSPYVDMFPGDTNISLVSSTSTATFLIREIGVYYVTVVGISAGAGTFTQNLVTTFGANCSARNLMNGRTVAGVGIFASGNAVVNYDQCFSVNTAGSGVANQFTFFTQCSVANFGFDVSFQRLPNSLSLLTTTNRTPDVSRRFSLQSFDGLADLSLEEKTC